LASPRTRKKFSGFLQLIGHPEMRGYRPVLALSRRQYSRAFIAVLDAVARQQNKRVWLEKTPRHLHHIDEISALVPASGFIHLIRNGEDVVASLYEVVDQHPERWPSIAPGNVARCVERWVQSIGLSRRYVGQPNHVMVRYEHLLEAPDEVIKSLCQFIGIPYEARMLERYSDHAPPLVLPFETWKQSVHRGIGKGRARKFDQLFNEVQKRHISMQVARVDLSAFI
jgi:hypothetical protein